MKQTEQHPDTHRHRQTDRQTDTHTHTHTNMSLENINKISECLPKVTQREKMINTKTEKSITNCDDSD